MKIGDEVYVHGYVDEIRKDCVIIRNDGGYFGTVSNEMFYYEEDGNGYGTMNPADTPQTDCPVAIVFGCDECHRPKCDYKNCRRCKWLVTDKCHECFGNELFEDSGYVTQTERSE